MYIDPDDANEYGIYGNEPLMPYDGPRDENGVPVVTKELRAGFDARLRMLRHISDQALKGVVAVNDDSPGLVKDAYRIRELLTTLEASIRAGNVAGAIIAANELGRIEERFNVRWAEPHVDRGRKTKAAARAGGKKTAASRKVDSSTFQSEVDTLVRKEGLSYSVACDLVAERHGCSGKTVSRKTTNPEPRKK